MLSVAVRLVHRRRAIAAACERLERRALLSLSPAGGEFRVNAVTGSVRDNVAVSADGDGDFVAAWESFGQDGSLDGVYARRFNAAGVAQDFDFRVNTYTPGNQTLPAVAMDADGDFVVAWSSNVQDGSLEGIFAQRYNAAGFPQGPEFRVNTFTTNVQTSPCVAMDATGNFVVAWHSVNQESSNNVGIYAQRYDASGARLGGEFLVNSSTPSSQYAPAIAMDVDGDFVISWDSGGQDGSSYGVYARRFDRTGAAQGGEFRVNTFTTGLQAGGVVGMSFGGDFVIAWHSQGQDGSASGVYAQRYNAAGTPQGAEFRVNAETSGGQLLPRVAMDADGDFLMTWNSGGQDGSGYGVFGRQYARTGVPIGSEFRVNTTTSGEQLAPRVAADHKGDFVIAWYGNGLDDPQSVFAQRYAESVDAAAPVVARVSLEDDTLVAFGVVRSPHPIPPYEVVESPVAQLVVSFSENLTTAGGASGPNSVTNPANWQLTRNGVDLTSTIDSISFGLNPAGRYVARFTLGVHFATGNITLTASPNVRDLAGHALDGDMNGVAGGSFFFPFNVGPVRARGAEFLVLPSTPEPQIATDGAGNLVTVYAAPDGSGAGVFARRFDAAGAPQGEAFRINTFTMNDQSFPSVAMDDAGNLLVAWQSYFQDGSDFGIVARRFDPAGVALGPEFTVNASVAFDQRYPSVAMNPQSGFVVSWQSVGTTGTGLFIGARRFDSSGAPLGSDLTIHTFAVPPFNPFFTRPVVATDDAGDFVVAWTDVNGQFGHADDIYARQYGAATGTLFPTFLVNMTTSFNQNEPAIAMDGDGDYVITWEGDPGDDVYARIFPLNAPSSGEFRVNDAELDDQRRPAVAMDRDGDFIVTWESEHEYAQVYHIYAKRYSRTGRAHAPEFRVDTPTPSGYQIQSAVAMNGRGDFVVAWQSQSPPNGIFARRFGRAAPVVSALADSPDPVTPPGSITLTAAGVGDDESVSSVRFYRESNGLAGLQYGAGGDTPVGVDTNGGDGWSVTASTAGLTSGTYTYYAQALDNENYVSAPASTASTVIAGAPAVTASSFVFATLPHRLRFTFNQNVSASLGLEDIQITNLSGGPGAAPSGLTYDAATNTATFSFAGPLPDGRFRARLIAAGISGAGGTMAADHLFEFTFLRGDANGDGRVNLQDFNILAANFGQSPRDFTQGDFNYDGTVNLNDFNILASRFGVTLGPGAMAGSKGDGLNGDSLPRGLIDELT